MNKSNLAGACPNSSFFCDRLTVENASSDIIKETFLYLGFAERQKNFQQQLINFGNPEPLFFVPKFEVKK